MGLEGENKINGWQPVTNCGLRLKRWRGRGGVLCNFEYFAQKERVEEVHSNVSADTPTDTLHLVEFNFFFFSPQLSSASKRRHCISYQNIAPPPFPPTNTRPLSLVFSRLNRIFLFRFLKRLYKSLEIFCMIFIHFFFGLLFAFLYYLNVAFV